MSVSVGLRSSIRPASSSHTDAGSKSSRLLGKFSDGVLNCGNGGRDSNIFFTPEGGKQLTNKVWLMCPLNISGHVDCPCLQCGFYRPDKPCFSRPMQHRTNMHILWLRDWRAAKRLSQVLNCESMIILVLGAYRRLSAGLKVPLSYAVLKCR